MISPDRSSLRFVMMNEELAEYQQVTETNDVGNLVK